MHTETTSEQRRVTSIGQAAQIVASTARVAIQLGALPVEAAIDAAIESCKQSSRDARNRTGIFRGETTTEAIADMLFVGAVAQDAAHNTHRPSTGPVRDHIRALLETTPDNSEVHK